jgi:hypothetical protein
MQKLYEIRKAVNGSLCGRPYVNLGLFITTIAICSSFLCSDIKFLAGAQKSPPAIHIGALVSYDTVNGRAARKAIQMAVDNVNKDKNLLNNTELVLHMLDTNCSAFPGVAAGKLSFVTVLISRGFHDLYEEFLLPLFSFFLS